MVGSVEELVVRNKKENLVLSFIIIIVCILSLMLNINNYFRVISSDYYNIKSINDLNVAIKNKERFISVDLRDAKLEMYSLKEFNEKENFADIYTLDIEGNNILILLKPNTMITDEVSLEIFNDTKHTYQIKNKLKDINYNNKVLSNLEYNFDRNVELIKFYITVILLVISIINIIYNIYGMFNPNKTRLYKKYNKKLYM